MSSMSFSQTQTEWEQEMSEKILDFTRSELYLELRFMKLALSELKPKADSRVSTLATDGEKMFYSTEQIMRLFRNNPKYLNRLFLHSILHCLFSHLWICDKRNQYLWGIACDIAVEYTIDHLNKPCTKRILGLVRRNMYESLEQDNVGISASQIYRYLSDMDMEKLQELHREFFTDDHVFWPKEVKNDMSVLAKQNRWNSLARQTSMEKRRKGEEEGEGEGNLFLQIKAQKKKRSYREFLKKFVVLKEELQIDPEEFDMTYYTYGLSIYKNLPLIEPLESREVNKIKDIVVAIDTSYSTNGELVEKFLRETLQILQEEDSFFHTHRMHILQCDEKVQCDQVIENRESLDRLFANFELKGGGNTDFRPVFHYVNQLEEQGEFENLCGLLYFTDGKGIYPKKKPSYQTAFLFLDDYDEETVPAWAIRHRCEN